MSDTEFWSGIRFNESLRASTVDGRSGDPDSKPVSLALRWNPAQLFRKP